MKILFVVASNKEHNGEEFIMGSPIFNIGVGKISAAYNITNLINSYQPDHIINFGSCGNLKEYKIGEVLEVGTVHNNIDVRPFAEYGHMPFSDVGSLKISDSQIELFTTDQFYDSHRTDYSEKYKEMIQKCDIVDMECYSLAYVCSLYGIKFSSYKWVSDNGASSEWEKNVNVGFKNFKKNIKKSLTLIK